MNVLIASESFVVREALENILMDIAYKPQILSVSNLDQIDLEEIINLDFIFMDINNNWKKQMRIIYDAKCSFEGLRTMLLDTYNSKEVFEKAVGLGVEGYIDGFKEKDEFIFILNKVLEGKKVYEAELVQSILSHNRQSKVDSLTKREIEVLSELSKGLNNKQISSNLYITEHTVKKHVSSILDKLRLKNRQEAVLYVAQNPIKIRYY